ncbi:MAG: glycosyltransferase family 39 protein [Candidatus Altiarchaeota archaeon]
MKPKVTSILDGLLGKGALVAALVVFIASFVVRLLLDLLFQLRFGWHAVNSVETWFYVGVMEGTKLPAYKLADPTVWILRAVGALLPYGASLYGVLLTSAALSALTAALLYFLVRELYDQRTGFAAGIVYGGMVEPLAISLVGFTHDHLQLALVVASLVLTVKAFKSGCRGAILCAAAYAALIYHALYINESIKVAVGVAAVYVGYRLLEHMSPKIWRTHSKDSAYKVFLLLLAIGMLTVGQFMVPSLVEGALKGLPQGRMGSGDVLPTNLLNIWLRCNILIFLMPFAAVAAYKRKDTIGITLTVVGLLIASVMDRGTRISDIGVAILVAYAIADWGAWKNKAKFKATLAFSISVFALMLILTTTRLVYAAVFLTGGSVLLYLLWAGKKQDKMLPLLVTVLLVGAAVNAAYTYSVDADRIVTEAEYSLLKWLGGNNKGGTILTAWDRGYMAEVVSGLKAVSTPNKINTGIHNLLWMPSGESSAKLSQEGVKYIMIRAADPSETKDVTGLTQSSRGLILRPEGIPVGTIVNDMASYKITRGQEDEHLKIIRTETDATTGEGFILYEISGGA